MLISGRARVLYLSPAQVGLARLAHYIAQPGQARVAGRLSAPKAPGEGESSCQRAICILVFSGLTETSTKPTFMISPITIPSFTPLRLAPPYSATSVVSIGDGR